MHLFVWVARIGIIKLPDAQCYSPLFRIEKNDEILSKTLSEIGKRTLLSKEKLVILYQFSKMALSVEGEFWECGVFRGGSARLFQNVLKQNEKNPRALRLFDSFEGLPAVDGKKDLHRQGDLADVNINEIKSFLCDPAPFFHIGWIPSSFLGLEKKKIAFAHVDVDLFQSVYDCCQFIYPRLSKGGIMIFDDYGFPTTPGARDAVNKYFSNQPAKPIILDTGQSIIYKS